MAKDTISELMEFLKPESVDNRLDLTSLLLDHLLSLSGSEEGVSTMIQNSKLIQNVLILTNDINEEIYKKSLFLLVNITSYEAGANLLYYKTGQGTNVIHTFVGYVLDPKKRYADAACMVLSNLTRLEEDLDTCVTELQKQLKDLLNIFVNTDDNEKGSNLNYLGPMFCNLSRSPRIRKWLVEENHVLLMKFIRFCNYTKSNIRRGGAIGTLKNLSFSTEYHDFLLSTELDLLTYLLNPLMGNEDYPDEEMDMLPIGLQYLPKEKERDPDIDIRKMLLEILNRLCTKKNCREIIRDNGVYYVLREYHKWEKDPQLLLACENVVDILIRKEDEIGIDDISTVQIPDEMTPRLIKMDEDYINSCQ